MKQGFVGGDEIWHALQEFENREIRLEVGGGRGRDSGRGDGG